MQTRTAIRVIHNAPYNGHTDTKFKTSRILKLNDLFDYQSLLLMYDYLSGNLPNSFDGCFPANSDMPDARATRQSKCLHVPKYRSQFAQRQPIYFLPILWNSWVRSLPDQPSRYQTKQIVKATLLQKYPHSVRCDNLACIECNPR